MVEWYERIINCYGNSTQKSLPAAVRLDGIDRIYQTVDEMTLRRLKCQYGISKALLYAQTPTNFKILFQNKRYKIIDLNTR